MTPRQLEILQHALGVDEYGRIPRGFPGYTRNHFCAGDADEPDCRELVAAGLMETFSRSYLPYYNCLVTLAGIKAMHKASPRPPKLTRSQRNYQAFLDADTGLTFREWIGVRA